MSIPSPKNDHYIDWASRWEGLELQLAALQAEKKALCAEIRDARGRPTLEAFKQAMRILNMDADKREARAAVDMEAAAILAAIRSAATGEVDATGAGASGAALVPDEVTEAVVEATPSDDARERPVAAAEVCDVPDAPVAVGTSMTIEEVLADLPLDFPDTEPSSDNPEWEEEVIVEEEPAFAEAEEQPYDHAAYLREKRDGSNISELVLGEPA